MGFFDSVGGILGSVGGVLNPVGMIGSALALGGDVYSAHQQAQSQKDANAMNQLMSREQMQFQERMSSTAYQRATKDMRRAGINPMLAAGQGGASSPSGASATADPVPSIAATTLSSATDQFRLANEVSTAKATRRSMSADADMKELELDYARSNKDAYFAAKQGVVNTVGTRAMNSISSSAKSIRQNWRDKSFPNLLELLTGPGYITDAEMRKRGRDRVMKKREERRKSGRY